ncbi:MAG: hypothetical protein H0X64_10835 [Gemmatimonadaceae bacterium]|nr:hypothetical protein [Gemmatimonadaceae bacterium]
MLKPPGAVHTVATGPGWTNTQDGRVLSRHPEREEALTAGFEIARIMGVEHVIYHEAPATSEPPSDDTPPG